VFQLAECGGDGLVSIGPIKAVPGEQPNVTSDDTGMEPVANS
jgi:hypothetical protein